MKSHELIPQTTTKMTTYIIQSIQTPQEFWSNNLGWVSVRDADRFTGNLTNSPEEGHMALLKIEDGSELALPLSGKWMPEFAVPYKCANCDHTAEYSALPPARDLAERFEPADTYTDVECPECGCLCFPVTEPEPAVAIPRTTVFSETEIIEILEIARVALQDAGRFKGILLDNPEGDHRLTLKTANGQRLNLPLGGKWVSSIGVDDLDLQGVSY